MPTLAEQGISSRVVRAHGHRVHLLEAGSGPLVLFVHGFPELAYSWRHQLSAVAEAGYHGVAVDQLGYGRSSKPVLPESYRVTELIRTLIATIEALGEQTAVIVGHDWGAPLAWAAAWTHPEIFTSVVALSVPFSGRGQVALPGSVHGELSPSEVERLIAGPDLVLYQEYLKQPAIPELEIEEDVRAFLTNLYFTSSADAGGPPIVGADVHAPLDERVAALRDSPLCLRPGARFRDGLLTPEALPAWLPQEDLDVAVAEFERTGFTGALNNYYRALDLNWEVLAPWVGRPVTVPALFVTGDRDATMMWIGEAIACMETAVPDLRGTIVYDRCGHWTQQERRAEFNRDLLAFLGDVTP
jgi:pimeloyl-ACP methyl ester carboxylesterase